ncbi:hypothetical protein ACL02U_26860 [Streptomyces sp. MS06]|uniref:hypothetical protein n=1 Tax=Streptomyces sp. MS06 TaxID=3385974 RepID=UPI00399EEF8B
MELRSVEELMDLLYACRGVVGPPVPGSTAVDLHDQALRTAALLRRSRPADKELQLTGLIGPIAQLLRPNDPEAGAGLAADAVRGLLGERVSDLLRRRPRHGGPAGDDALTLRHAEEESRAGGFDAGVLEDWRTVLELVAARNSRMGAVD